MTTSKAKRIVVYLWEKTPITLVNVQGLKIKVDQWYKFVDVHQLTGLVR